MVKGGGLRDTLDAMLADKTIFRSPGALGPAYERPETVTDETSRLIISDRWYGANSVLATCSASSWLSTTSTRE
jgi:hypothetical protein